MPYRHPGQAFIQQQGPLLGPAAVERYGDFLRQAAGLGAEPPISLDRIYTHFAIPIPRQAPLQEQQGLLVDGESGLILIKEDDPRVRQRFTEGHELMELLFDAQTQQVEPRQAQPQAASFCPEGAYKERLCDRGAAALLMPAASFGARLGNLGMSLQTGRALAATYQTSLLATLLRMVQLSPSGAQALVMWQLGWQTPTQQAEGKLPPQLRPAWQALSPAWSLGRLSPSQGAAAGSVVALAPQFDQPLRGTEVWQFDGELRRCYVEALPLRSGRRRSVLALVQLLA